MIDKSVSSSQPIGASALGASAAVLQATVSNHTEPRSSDVPVSSTALLGGANTLVIEHMGMQYVLRATRNGKLILTK